MSLKMMPMALKGMLILALLSGSGCAIAVGQLPSEEIAWGEMNKPDGLQLFKPPIVFYLPRSWSFDSPPEVGAHLSFVSPQGFVSGRVYLPEPPTADGSDSPLADRLSEAEPEEGEDGESEPDNAESESSESGQEDDDSEPLRPETWLCPPAEHSQLLAQAFENQVVERGNLEIPDWYVPRERGACGYLLRSTYGSTAAAFAYDGILQANESRILLKMAVLRPEGDTDVAEQTEAQRERDALSLFYSIEFTDPAANDLQGAAAYGAHWLVGPGWQAAPTQLGDVAAFIFPEVGVYAQLTYLQDLEPGQDQAETVATLIRQRQAAQQDQQLTYRTARLAALNAQQPDLLRLDIEGIDGPAGQIRSRFHFAVAGERVFVMKTAYPAGADAERASALIREALTGWTFSDWLDASQVPRQQAAETPPR